MKVLQVTTHINVGGIANYILTLSKTLKSKGVEVIVASSGGILKTELDRYGIPHRQLGLKTKFEFGPKVLRSALRLSRIVKDEGVEVIHAHTRVSQVASLIASRICGVPFVTTCHGYFKKRLRGIIDTWGVKVIAISDAVKEHLTDDLGVDQKRISLIYSGVDVSRFSEELTPLRLREIKIGLGLKDAPVIGTIGRLSSIKGQKFFIAAMKDIVAMKPDVQAILLGSGDEELALRKLAESLGVAGSIRFYGSCADTHKFLSIMDVFVFPSVKEGLGLGLLEALASARACVASRIGGIGNIIKDGYNGVLVDVGDSKAISGAALKLLDDPSLRSEMGRRGRRLVSEKFTLEEMAENMARLYREVTGCKR